MLLPEFKMWDTFDNGAKMLGRPSDLSADGTGGAYFTQQCVYYASPSGTIEGTLDHLDLFWEAETQDNAVSLQVLLLAALEVPL